MKFIKTFAAVVVLSTVSFASMAQTISASAATLDEAEAKIAAQAQQIGSGYKIVDAYTKNGVRMTAALTK